MSKSFSVGLISLKFSLSKNKTALLVFWLHVKLTCNWVNSRSDRLSYVNPINRHEKKEHMDKLIRG